MGLVFLAWPGLFGSLGVSFLIHAFAPPEGGFSPAWLVCGVLFLALAAGSYPMVRATLRDLEGPRTLALGLLSGGTLAGIAIGMWIYAAVT
jgi:hypothetical protein